MLIRQLEAIFGWHLDFRMLAVKRRRIKPTRFSKPRARWSRLIAATWMQRGSGHTPPSGRRPDPRSVRDAKVGKGRPRTSRFDLQYANTCTLRGHTNIEPQIWREKNPPMPDCEILH
ncbi:MAG: hypothetical protein ACLP0J_27445 [Solirubrobacteraceae bacterium]